MSGVHSVLVRFMAFMGLLLLTESRAAACQVAALQILGILSNGKNILAVEVLCVIGLSSVALIAFSWVGSLYCRVISRLYEGSWLCEGLAIFPFDLGILLSELLSDFFKVFSLLLVSLEFCADVFTRGDPSSCHFCAQSHTTTDSQQSLV